MRSGMKEDGMTDKEAIASLLDSSEKLIAANDKLKEENAFLTDTISKHNMGKIVSERRNIIRKDKDADEKLTKAHELESRYSALVEEIGRKNDNLDNIVKKAVDEALRNQEKEYVSMMGKQSESFGRKARNWKTAAICGILVGIAGILSAIII